MKKFLSVTTIILVMSFSGISADVSINSIISSGASFRMTAGNTYIYTFANLKQPSTIDPTTYTFWGFGNLPEDRVVLNSYNSDMLSETEDSWTVKMYVQAEGYPNGTYSMFYTANNTLVTSDKPSPGGARFLSQGGYPVDLGGKVEFIMNIGSADISSLSVGAIAASNELYFLSKDYTFPIPEPSSLSLLLVTGGMLTLMRRTNGTNKTRSS